MPADAKDRPEHATGNQHIDAGARSTTSRISSGDVENPSRTLNDELTRLRRIAHREHLAGFVAAIIAGVLVIGGLVGLAITADSLSVYQWISVFGATTVPGFLSRVFFNREATIESRIADVSDELHKAEMKTLTQDRRLEIPSTLRQLESLRQLTPKQRLILEQSLTGTSQKDIAKMHNLSTREVSEMLKDGREALSKILGTNDSP